MIELLTRTDAATNESRMVEVAREIAANAIAEYGETRRAARVARHRFRKWAHAGASYRASPNAEGVS